MNVHFYRPVLNSIGSYIPISSLNEVIWDYCTRVDVLFHYNVKSRYGTTGGCHMFETYQVVDCKSKSTKIRFNCNISCECLSIGETLVLFDNNKRNEKYEFLVTNKLRRILQRTIDYRKDRRRKRSEQKTVWQMRISELKVPKLIWYKIISKCKNAYIFIHIDRYGYHISKVMLSLHCLAQSPTL